jgi:hypothetical protein
MTAPVPPAAASPPPAARALPYALLFCAALMILALIQSRRAADATDGEKAAKATIAAYTDSLKADRKLVAVSQRSRDSLAAIAARLERPAAVAQAKTDTAKTALSAEIAAGAKLLADSLATLAQVRAELARTDSIGALLVAKVTAQTFSIDSLHRADLAVMAQDTVVMKRLEKENDDAAKQHVADTKALAGATRSVFYRATTGVFAVGGGALCGAGGWLLLGPAGAIIGGGACAALVATLR